METALQPAGGPCKDDFGHLSPQGVFKSNIGESANVRLDCSILWDLLERAHRAVTITLL